MTLFNFTSEKMEPWTHSLNAIQADEKPGLATPLNSETWSLPHNIVKNSNPKVFDGGKGVQVYTLERKDKDKTRNRDEEMNKRRNFGSYEMTESTSVALGPGDTDLIRAGRPGRRRWSWRRGRGGGGVCSDCGT
jgi:hypothetical protein